MVCPRGSYATIRSLICLFKWWQAPARENLHQILSRTLVKRLRRTTGAPAQPRHYRSLCLPFVSSVRTSSPLHFPVLIYLLLSRHLNDASHRETYESAHSAILAVFAAQLGLTTAASDQGMGMSRPTFVEKIVPFYIRCLLDVRPAVPYLFSVGH